MESSRLRHSRYNQLQGVTLIWDLIQKNQNNCKDIWGDTWGNTRIELVLDNVVCLIFLGIMGVLRYKGQYPYS